MAEGLCLPLLEIAKDLGASLLTGGGDIVAHGIGTDTRTLQPGELFVALRGPRFDAHRHLDDARAAGAVAALVATPVDDPLPQLLVDDTRLALGRLAAAWRQRCAVPTVAITGSNGKTTVKEMLATIVAEQGPSLATRGNLNNDIGLPLTLLRLTTEHRYAVVEMGANHPGEIAYLSAIGRPDVAVVNNAGPAHLEGFGDIAGVARSKGEIFGGLAADGVAVFNGDDHYASVWRALASSHRCISFGIKTDSEVRAEAVDGQSFTLVTPDGTARVELPLPGRHNIYNALAAAAAAHALGLAPVLIAQGLHKVSAIAGRLNLYPVAGGATLIDDSYNANPASLNAALAVLMQRPGRHFLVLGDLAELGSNAESIHKKIGEDARRLGVEALYSNGPLSRHSAASFGPNGQHFDDTDSLIDALRARVGPDVTVLIKGSRSAGMERVTHALRKQPNGTDSANRGTEYQGMEN